MGQELCLDTYRDELYIEGLHSYIVVHVLHFLLGS